MRGKKRIHPKELFSFCQYSEISSKRTGKIICRCQKDNLPVSASILSSITRQDDNVRPEINDIFCGLIFLSSIFPFFLHDTFFLTLTKKNCVFRFSFSQEPFKCYVFDNYLYFFEYF